MQGQGSKHLRNGSSHWLPPSLIKNDQEQPQPRFRNSTPIHGRSPLQKPVERFFRSLQLCFHQAHDHQSLTDHRCSNTWHIAITFCAIWVHLNAHKGALFQTVSQHRSPQIQTKHVIPRPNSHRIINAVIHSNRPAVPLLHHANVPGRSDTKTNVQHTSDRLQVNTRRSSCLRSASGRIFASFKGNHLRQLMFVFACFVTIREPITRTWCWKLVYAVLKCVFNSAFTASIEQA